MSGMSSKRLAVIFVVLLLVLVLLASFVDWDEVFKMLQGINRWQLALASIFLVLGFLAYAQRWRLLLEKRSRLIPTFHASNAGNLVNTLLPLRPGDVARIVMLGAEEELSMLLITSSIVVERWFEQIMRLVALVAAMSFGMGMAVSVNSIIGIVILIVVLYLLMFGLIRYREKVLIVCPGWLAKIPRVNEQSACTALGNPDRWSCGYFIHSLFTQLIDLVFYHFWVFLGLPFHRAFGLGPGFEHPDNDGGVTGFVGACAPISFYASRNIPDIHGRAACVRRL